MEKFINLKDAIRTATAALKDKEWPYEASDADRVKLALERLPATNERFFCLNKEERKSIERLKKIKKMSKRGLASWILSDPKSCSHEGTCSRCGTWSGWCTNYCSQCGARMVNGRDEVSFVWDNIELEDWKDGEYEDLSDDWEDDHSHPFADEV